MFGSLPAGFVGRMLKRIEFEVIVSTSRQREFAEGLGSLSRDSANELTARLAQTKARLGAAEQELETLYSALDHVHSGLLILDGELCARYNNPALETMFQTLTPGEISKRPRYADLLRAGAVSADVDVDDYVARRLAWVSSGNPLPMDLPMKNGTVLRCHIAVLPDGGRMLIYSDVTDIVRNAEAMERLASIDGMTGIYNRRHFLALADREWDRARRYRRPLSLLMIDIDYFKAINDRFGHEIGDRAIVHVVNVARDCRRASDLLARIGGEEFAMLLPETDLDHALVVAERLRCEVAGSPLAELAHSFTISIGVATADEKMDGLSDLIKMADHSLYAAKRAGRNKVVCSVSEIGAPRVSPIDDCLTEPGSNFTALAQNMQI
jgi:diguanylate cyclase (GGDEF)-like protein